MDLFTRMLGLSSEGFACAQIMMILALESEGAEDPDLIRTVGALNNGFRDNGLICGAFTGGACVISYFAGQGEKDEVADSAYDEMVQELYAWFAEQAGGKYGGVECPVILDGDKSNKLNRCPGLVEDTFYKAMEILEEHGLL